VAVPLIPVLANGNGEVTMLAAIRMTVSLLKLRIGVAVAASALAGMAAASGAAPSWWQAAGLTLAVLGASGAAGAFNHYHERDLDRLMRRTQSRPFASGTFTESPWWLAGFLALLAASLALAVVSGGTLSALFVFLGAFTYGIVYTVWLKRRTVWNIVIGGLAGSFAVLAGAAAVDPSPQVVPVVLAIVLFLWTPPHFWSLAAAKGEDYARAGVPMLPIVVPAYAWTLAILTHTAALVAISLVPLWFGKGLLFGLGAGIGGAIFLWKSVVLHRSPTRQNAMANFLASLLQLLLLILGVVLDGLVGSSP
jgi:protoheme IX farnesyltransferase